MSKDNTRYRLTFFRKSCTRSTLTQSVSSSNRHVLLAAPTHNLSPAPYLPPFTKTWSAPHSPPAPLVCPRLPGPHRLRYQRHRLPLLHPCRTPPLVHKPQQPTLQFSRVWVLLPSSSPSPMAAFSLLRSALLTPSSYDHPKVSFRIADSLTIFHFSFSLLSFCILW